MEDLGLDKDQIKLLKGAFDSFDQDKKGFIEIDMVAQILDMLGTKLDKETFDALIIEIDEENTGKLVFDQFCELAAKFLVEEDTEKIQRELREAFRLYDKDGYGYITTDVLREILSELDETLDDNDLDEMIDEIDADGSGTVDFEEFMEIMTGE